MSKPEFLQRIRKGLQSFRTGTAEQQRQEADVDARLKAEQKQADEALNLARQNASALAIAPTTTSTLYEGTHGDVRSIPGDANYRGVVVNGGMFKSTDGGATWRAMNTGLISRNSHHVLALVIDPATPSTLYVGTLDGVFKSTNGGATWGAINTGLRDLHVSALAIDPQHPTTLYAGISSRSTVGGVYKSTDGGASWSNPASVKGFNDIRFETETGFGHPGILALAIDPKNPTTLYAGTDIGYVFKTTNGGVTWSSPSQYFTYHALYGHHEHGIAIGLRGRSVETLAIDPATPSTLYAGTHGGGGGIFKSIDGGATWSAASAGMEIPGYVHYEDLADYSNDQAYALAIDPATPSTLYAGTSNSVFKSTSAGAYWSAVLTNHWVYALAIDPATPSTLYAGASDGVFKSTDGGASWRPS